MTTQIRRSNVLVSSPVLWMRYQAARQSDTITHPLAGGATAVIHRATRKRRVQLELFFESETDAHECSNAHAQGGTFRITETGRTTWAMSYVVVGQITVTLDPDTAKHWIVTVDAQEV